METEQIEDLTDGQAIDRILTFGTNRPEFLSIVDIQKFIISGISEERLKHLFSKIERIKPNIANTVISEYSLGIEVLSEAKNFLKKGGYTEFENIQNEKREAKRKALNLEMRLAASNIEANETQQKTQRRQYRLTVILILIGILNLIVFTYQVFIKDLLEVLWID
jgi:hypothetical protein